MPVTDFGSDWNAPYRLPQGWTTLPDGSVGPSSAVPDWLKQLIPSPGASQPYGPNGYPDSLPPQPRYPPGGGLIGYPAATPGGPSMGYPAQAAGGASTEGSWYDPRNWFKANPNATFQAGEPMGPDVTGATGSNPLTGPLGGGNPYWRAALAAGGVMAPTPTANDAAPTNAWFQRPSGVGGMPGPQVTNPGQPARPYTPTPEHYPSWPTPGVAGGVPSKAATHAAAPPGSPSDTPRPGRSSAPSANAGASGAAAAPPASNPRFVQLDQGQNIDPTARNRGPQMTALNLAGLFGGGAQRPSPSPASPNANPANLPTRNAQPVSGPLAAGGVAPWYMGPFQKGVFGPDWRTLAAAHSGYQ
jgi:hypothetical protein